MFFCFFLKFRFMPKKCAAGLPKDSCQRNLMSFYSFSQYFHTLPKAVSYTVKGSLSWGGECSEVTSHGPHPLTLSPDAFARGWLFYLFSEAQFIYGCQHFRTMFEWYGTKSIISDQEFFALLFFAIFFSPQYQSESSSTKVVPGNISRMD